MKTALMKLKDIVKRLCAIVTIWFFVCIVLVAIIIFFGNVLSIYHWVYRSIFAWVFYTGSTVLSLIFLLLYNFAIKLSAELAKGKSYKAAFRAAYESVNPLIPQGLLHRIIPEMKIYKFLIVFVA